MEEINRDLSTDYLDDEKFDFDLASSPINQEQSGQIISKPGNVDDEEVFCGPVGFTEKCVATRAKIQDENNIKPLSPLTGQQCVEIFQEATKVALRLEKLSSAKSVACEDSPISSSSKSSLSSSILKLSTSSSESPCWLTGKLSSGSSKGTILSQFEFDKENIQPSEKISINNQLAPPNTFYEKQIIESKVDGNGDFDNENIFHVNEPQAYSAMLEEQKFFDTEELSKTGQNVDTENRNIQLLLVEENLNVAKNEQHVPAISKKITISSDDNETTKSEQTDKNVLKREVAEQKVAEQKVAEQKVAEMKEVKSNKIPVVKPRGLNLPRPGLRKSKLPKSKNTEKSQSAFSSPIRSIGSSKKREAVTENEPEEKSTRAKAQSVEKPTANISANSKFMQKSVPAKLPQEATKINSRPAKTLAKRKIFNSSEALDKVGRKDCKPKLPVPEQRKIPGPRPRRRRSSSLSSLDSSQSSASSQTSQDDNSSKSTRPSTRIPTTKATLSTFGLKRRSKLQDTTANKKPQPLKALPRPRFTSSVKNSKTETTLAKAMPPPPPTTEQDLKDDKIPLAATPRSSSSLPVARRRSSFKSSLSSTSSREGSPSKYFTPSKPGKITEPTSSACKRRSAIPTPTCSAPSSASRRFLRSSGDDSMLLSLSPASKPKKNQKQTNRKLIPDDDNAAFISSAQTVDDLLDNTLCILGDVLPIQPQPIAAAQSDLIDLSGLI